MAVTHDVLVKRRSIAFKAAQENIAKKAAKRQEANREIVEIISKIVEDYPDLRFGQILCMLDLNKDIFYHESVDVLETARALSDNAV